MKYMFRGISIFIFNIKSFCVFILNVTIGTIFHSALSYSTAMEIYGTPVSFDECLSFAFKKTTRLLTTKFLL